MLRYLPYLVLFALWIYAFVDCLGTPERDVRGLPKVVWVLIILFFGTVLIGPLAWLLIGRRRGRVGPAGATPAEWHRANRADRGDRPGPAGQPLRAPSEDWIPPDDNPAFLRSLSERLNQNRRDGDGRPSAEGE
ncbi:PLD nuclease N-terminal domain-containing protein [Actinacidiphila acidipaludis]|uniref:PLD nuclease N-terminal domain-containing protein n=1 Tax=Actinacidiphila acidipaludis TaxID=2873382 RepID=A0ABS7Q4Z3_9ACTN|nr:PLD nuclease N-terminal domain-containing protein [Streptomyces acidipaludis]MBY8878172.1 PLD nuclease N-terminal domain-containing protein [Streptomyces acidipaludis]